MTPAAIFATPEGLPLVLLAPAVWLLLRLLARVRRKRLERILGPRAALLAREAGPGRRRARRALFSAASLLAVLAALGPLLGLGSGPGGRGRVDLVIALDVSRSMLARDVDPSRLERARAEIAELAGNAAGDRIALVAFAGEARVVVPLTRDLASFAKLASRTGPLSVRKGGTDLGAALAVARGALAGDGDAPRAVLLLTDGEDHGGGGRAAAADLAADGIAVHAVGFGSTRGAKIPVETTTGESFLRDRTGREVVTSLEDGSLRALAEAGGGEYARAESGTLSGLYESVVRPRARTTAGAADRPVKENRFQWPLMTAFLLWILDLGISDRRR